MKRTIYNIIGILILLCGLWSCQEEIGLQQQAAGENEMLLKLTARAPEATADANAEYNEDKVLMADVFFFGQANGNCIYAQTGVTADADNTLRVKLDPDIIIDGNQYHIYVIANRGENFTGIDSEYQGTIANLKAQTVTTVWQDGDTPEASLLMDGEADVTVSRSTPGKITLTRAMAKISLSVTAEDEIEVDGKKYTPVRENMTVGLLYDVQRTNLADNYTVDATNDYIFRVNRNYTASENGSYTHVPFYSYPNPADTENRKDSYLLLCVPWNNTDEGQEALNYYYQVPITGTDDPALMLRNHFYKINVNVGVLGGLSPAEAVPLEPDFVILDWFTMDIDAAMQNYQYLVLDEYSSVMNNEDELRMPYASSSEIVTSDNQGESTLYTKVVQVTCPDYSEVEVKHLTWGKTQEGYEYQGDVPSNYSITVDGDELVFNHPITDNDNVPYTITVEVYNRQELHKTWTITQYPAIYIEGNRADHRLFVAGQWTNTTSGWDKDDWYKEVHYNSNRQMYNLGSVQNPESVDGTGTNRNPNNYTIYVTSFNVGDNYKIGDPRELTPRNLGMEDLTSYYPTRQTDTERIIAPAFKIASSRGKTLPITFDNAERRCAAYQEDGYGAGRWRVPTEAEIEFIVNLSANGKIPTLFDGEYWSASGKYYSSDDQEFNSPTQRENSFAVRCVYDVWYWGEERASNPDEFDWRDEPMN